MALTVTTIYNASLLAGTDTGFLSTGLPSTSTEACICFEISLASGTFCYYRFNDSTEACLDEKAAFALDYNGVGTIGKYCGVYFAARTNMDQVKLKNIGSVTMTNVKIYVITASSSGETINPNININDMVKLNENQIKELVRNIYGKDVKVITPIQQVLSADSSSANYCYFGDLFVNPRVLTTTTISELDIKQSQAKQNQTILNIKQRDSYDGLSQNMQMYSNLLFDNLDYISGTFQLYFIGYKIQYG